MKKTAYILAALLLSFACCAPGKDAENRNYMWFDCEANYATLSHPDSIEFYLEKVRALGFGNVVVDVKSIMGETLYDSGIAPYMGEFEGVEQALRSTGGVMVFDIVHLGKHGLWGDLERAMRNAGQIQ